jgi:transposase-like protein
MPVDQWYDADTREAATARVLERRATKPNDRNVLMVVAEEFGVAQQTLRAWVEEAAPETATPARKPRPKFSQVVTRRIVPEEAPPEPEPEVEAEGDDVSEEAPSASADEVTEEAPPALTPNVTDDPPQRQPSPAAEEVPPVPASEVAADDEDEDKDEDEPRTAPSSPAPASAIAALEAEAATLRAHNEALKQAMRVLLDV